MNINFRKIGLLFLVLVIFVSCDDSEGGDDKVMLFLVLEFVVVRDEVLVGRI